MNTEELIVTLEKYLTKEELCNYARILNKVYDISISDEEMWRVLCDTFDNKFNNLFRKYSDRYIANILINYIITKYYPGERIIKYHLVKKFIANEKDVTLFEIYADNSRADLCRVNGKSIAYEIKSALDNLERLHKQVDDYSKLFEYIYVVTDEKHLEKVALMIPDYCGIYRYKLNDGICKFKCLKKASKSPNINSDAQIRNLSSKDLAYILSCIKIKNIPQTRAERENLIIGNLDERKINSMFKKAIRKKFEVQWNFLKEHYNNILPIDIQSFFHQNISPEVRYYKYSSNEKI